MERQHPSSQMIERSASLDKLCPSPSTSTFLYTGSETSTSIPPSTTHIIVDTGVTTIHEYAFFNIPSLTTVQLPNSVTSIGAKAFMKCRSLTDVNLPQYLTSIGELAFGGCEGLVHLEIPPIVKTIGPRAFLQCGGLVSVRLPPGLERVEEGTFAVCRSLLAVEVPPSVESIGKNAFLQCPRLALLSVPNARAEIAPNAFYGSDLLLSGGLEYDDPRVRARILERYDGLPLHRVCGRVRPKVGMVEECLAEYPDAARGRDWMGLSALHVLAMNPAVGREVWERVWRADRGAVVGRSLGGMTPLHFLACNWKAGVELYLADVVDATTDAYLDGLAGGCGYGDDCDDADADADDADADDYDGTDDRNEYTPPPKTQYLTSLTDNEGSTPTTLAIKSQAPLSVQLLLFSHQPTTSPSLHTLHPLSTSTNPSYSTNHHHQLQLQRIEESYLHQIITPPPSTPSTARRRPSLLPSQLSTPALVGPHCHLSSPDSWPAVLRHGWVRYVAVASLSVVREVLVPYLSSTERCPGEVLRGLAVMEDLEGCKAVDVAVGSLRRVMEERMFWMGRYEMDEGEGEGVGGYGGGGGGMVFESEGCLVVRGRDRRTVEYYRNAFRECCVADHHDVSHTSRGASGTTTTRKKHPNTLSKSSTRRYLHHRGLFQNPRSPHLSTNIFRRLSFSSSADNTTPQITRDEFTRICRDNLDHGQPHRSVVWKFSRDCDTFRHERDVRAVAELSPAMVVEAMEWYDAEEDDGFGAAVEEMQKRRGRGEDEAGCVPPLRYAMVMPCGDCNLGSIVRNERLSMMQVRRYAEDIALALRHLHQRGIVHGDLTMEHVVRLGGTLRLVSLGASARFRVVDRPVGGEEEKRPEGGGGRRGLHRQKSFGDARDLPYVGRKFSSGALPPEMVFLTNGYADTNKYESYFTKPKAATKKLKPKVSSTGDVFLFKTFSTEYRDTTDSAGNVLSFEVVKYGSLPYEPLLASPSFDMWSFGTVLYAMCTGRTLFNVDVHGDLVDGDATMELFIWNDNIKKTKLDMVSDPLARELLDTLLSRDPQLRGDIDAVLQTRFFQSDFSSDLHHRLLKEAQTDNLKTHKLTKEFNATIDRCASVLSKSIFHLDELKIPTCYIILPFSDTPTTNTNTNSNSNSNNSNNTDPPASTLQLANTYAEITLKTLLNSRTHLEFAKELTKHNFFSSIIQPPPPCYLHLIDEYTGQRVPPTGPYPLPIPTQQDPVFLEHIFSIMSVALTALKSVGDMTTLVNLFQPSGRTVSKDDQSIGLFEYFLRAGDYPNSMEDEKEVMSIVSSLSNDSSTRGGRPTTETEPKSTTALSQYQAFILEKDPLRHTSNLRRMLDRNGRAIWVTEESALVIERERGNGVEVGMVVDPKDRLRGANAALVEEKELLMKENKELRHRLRKEKGLGGRQRSSSSFGPKNGIFMKIK